MFKAPQSLLFCNGNQSRLTLPSLLPCRSLFPYIFSYLFSLDGPSSRKPSIWALSEPYVPFHHNPNHPIL